MKVKVFQFNHNGKIEFTRAELEKLLNEVYADGYNDSESSHWKWNWTSPSLNITETSISNNAAVDTATTLTSTNCETNKISAISDNSTADTSDKTINKEDAKVYKVKVNSPISTAELSKLISDFLDGVDSHSTSKKVDDAFDKLAKELNF